MKFNKNREVSVAWCKIPCVYTGIKHPNNTTKELIIMKFFGKHVSACWRNNKLNKVGITFLLKCTKDGFLYKDKEYKFKKLSYVW